MYNQIIYSYTVAIRLFIQPDQQNILSTGTHIKKLTGL